MAAENQPKARGGSAQLDPGLRDLMFTVPNFNFSRVNATFQAQPKFFHLIGLSWAQLQKLGFTWLKLKKLGTTNLFSLR